MATTTRPIATQPSTPLATAYDETLPTKWGGRVAEYAKPFACSASFMLLSINLIGKGVFGSGSTRLKNAYSLLSIASTLIALRLFNSLEEKMNKRSAALNSAMLTVGGFDKFKDLPHVAKVENKNLFSTALFEKAVYVRDSITRGLCTNGLPFITFKLQAKNPSADQTPFFVTIFENEQVGQWGCYYTEVPAAIDTIGNTLFRYDPNNNSSNPAGLGTITKDTIAILRAIVDGKHDKICLSISDSDKSPLARPISQDSTGRSTPSIAAPAPAGNVNTPGQANGQVASFWRGKAFDILCSFDLGASLFAATALTAIHSIGKAIIEESSQPSATQSRYWTVLCASIGLLLLVRNALKPFMERSLALKQTQYTVFGGSDQFNNLPILDFSQVKPTSVTQKILEIKEAIKKLGQDLNQPGQDLDQIKQAIKKQEEELKKIEQDFANRITAGIFGQEAFKSVPYTSHLVEYINNLLPNDLPASVMRGIDSAGRLLISLKVKPKEEFSDGTDETFTITLQEPNIKSPHKKWLCNYASDEKELFFKDPSRVAYLMGNLAPHHQAFNDPRFPFFSPFTPENIKQIIEGKHERLCLA